jgi:hypothetical protein
MAHQLWEILVPRFWNNESEILLAHHHEWDAHVRAVAGGLTIFRTATGEWVSPEGTRFREKMIPVRVACSEEAIRRIIDFTIKHYDQEAVMAYRLSEKVLIVYRDPEASLGAP